MENFPVAIVGAGPSGLVLGLCLAKHKVQSVIIEREPHITEDPRGVYLSGDAVRVLCSLGMQEDLAKIGHESHGMQFHRGSLASPAIFKRATDVDWRNQVVPDGIMQIQPELERTLRSKITESGFCQVRSGCEVMSVEEVDRMMLVEYRDMNGHRTRLTSNWLVGADGKRGFVRKHYLEPVAGVQQETGLFAYEGTWIAANLQIKLPTPETHPDFPVWETGMTPEDVYDLFWPQDVHFISPPGKPTAAMRFGPEGARLWRHEFIEPTWDGSQNAEQLLWEHITPMLTRDHNDKGQRFRTATFPQDCIEILRCGPYTFAQKVANKWFYHRTILIGDAAHCFPPFGGQGIAAGIRDAQALAWRLALFDKLPELEQPVLYEMLDGWMGERKQGVDDAARFTKANGEMVNNEESWARMFLRSCVGAIERVPFLPRPESGVQRAEREAYRPVKGGFFVTRHQGGCKAAQIYLRQDGSVPLLSDEILRHDESLMTLLVSGDGDRAQAIKLIEEIQIPDSIISAQSVVQFHGNKQERQGSETYHACSLADMSQKTLRAGYAPDVYQERFGRASRYIIVRPDFILFSTASNLTELAEDLQALKMRFRL